jgi:hypothetical protein
MERRHFKSNQPTGNKSAPTGLDGSFSNAGFETELLKVCQNMISDLSPQGLQEMLESSDAKTKEELLFQIENAMKNLPREEIFNLLMNSPFGPMILQQIRAGN